MEKILIKISDLIDTYESGTYITIENLQGMMRELTSQYYYLTKYNIDAFKKHNTIQFYNKGSVASGLIKANEECPELRLTRKILYACDRVINSMRSEISTMRKE